MNIFAGKSKQKLLLFCCWFTVSLILVTGIPAIAFYNAESPAIIAQKSRAKSDLAQLFQQESTPAQLLQIGKQFYQNGQFSQAIDFWQQAAEIYRQQAEVFNQAQVLNYLSLAYQELGELKNAEEALKNSLEILSNQNQNEDKKIAILAQNLNTKGSLELARGQSQTALETWQKAEAAYTRANNEIGKLGSQINQAQALKALGKYRQAKLLLEKLVIQLQTQPDSLLKAQGLRSLGIALQTSGDLLQSKEILEQSWAISQKFAANTDTSATLMSIGNIARDLEQYEVARDYYQEAAKLAVNELNRLQAELNLISLFVETEQWEQAAALIAEVELKIAELAPSRSSIYARVNLAASATELAKQTQQKNRQTIASIVATGVQQAREIGDRRAEAYSLYQLSKIYSENQQWSEAQTLIQQALQIAQQLDAADLVARTAAELGSILKQQGNLEAAKSAYREAYQNLQSLRSDLVAIDSEIQYNFTSSVEPIYRQFVSILLQPDATQDDLQQAREVIEALQIVELDNFFQDACLDVKPVQIDQIDTEAAVIYPIILPSRLEVILSLPNQPLRHYSTQIPAPEIETTLQKAFSSLYLGYSNQERLRLFQKIYDWLIKPAETELNRQRIATLVFVLDGSLRNLPMAALYDGQQYLIEKYSIALSSGLQLFPQGLAKQKLNALTVGLTEARQGFSPLPAVEAEIKQIAEEIDTKVLLDREFTTSQFQKSIGDRSFSIVHLATHGQFSSNPEETFLLTWDNRLNVTELDVLFEKRRVGILKPIELLVLSACESASGDRRATLGLAGLALRSGAYSTLASLWSVNDESTALLMSEFYQQLTQQNQSITKAEAIRQAQLALLKNPVYDHPYFWAAFVLIGNWL
ncbi:MAG: CHAT domain-containing protein [Oscillatoria sp. PMC 1068.18]|nr:CHAT domain-containing protein [Oscillatoria sp. PMC 1076.18]MEC4990359.1 CHAT domain-containing protein [Oscillatoria sp. PMC 1068.18]